MSPAPSRFRVLITDRAWPDSEMERRILEPIGADVIEPPEASEQTLIRFARDADAIGTCWAPVTSNVISAAEKCRIVARFGIGLDNIDVEEATRRQIPVTNVPDYCISEVSDHTLALLLASARRITFFDQQAKQGQYDLKAGLPLRRISQQTLGIVGLGRIGQAVAAKARALGIQVMAHTRSGNDYGVGCPLVTLNELLQESDFVSLHLPLTEKTHQILAEKEFALMRAHAVVINTSRGALIDHAALWSALQQRKIGGAALDVFDPEPPDLSNPLFHDPRVIVTPHSAFFSEESVAELRQRAAKQIRDALQGQRPHNVINPQILDIS